MSDNNIKVTNKEYHIFNLELYATPGFVSGTQQYIGTLEDYSEFVQAGLKPEMNREYFNMLNDAYNQYSQGQNDIKIQIAYSWFPFAAKAELIATKEYHEENFHREIMNIYDFPYDFNADGVDVDIIYIKNQKNQYYRYIRPVMTKLTMINTIGEHKDKTNGGYWGHPAILEPGNGMVRARLFLQEKRFKNEASCLKDISKPSPLNFQCFFFEIFGDG